MLRKERECSGHAKQSARLTCGAGLPQVRWRRGGPGGCASDGRQQGVRQHRQGPQGARADHQGREAGQRWHGVPAGAPCSLHKARPGPATWHAQGPAISSCAAVRALLYGTLCGSRERAPGTAGAGHHPLHPHREHELPCVHPGQGGRRRPALPEEAGGPGQRHLVRAAPARSASARAALQLGWTRAKVAGPACALLSPGWAGWRI